jgi:hypothetical protein
LVERLLCKCKALSSNPRDLELVETEKMLVAIVTRDMTRVGEGWMRRWGIGESDVREDSGGGAQYVRTGSSHPDTSVF